MSDRFRIGELLAAIGAVALTVLLLFGAWFSYDVALPDGQNAVSGAVGARHLGWFAVLVTGLAAIAGLVFLFRVVTSETPDRPVLQAPVAYFAALFALIVDLVRVFIFPPGEITIRIGDLAPNLGVPDLRLDTDLAGGGILGLVALLLLVVGTWLAMSDERKGSPAAIAQTEALLSQSPVRPAPPAGAVDDSDAEVVAQDQTGDPSEPATPPTGDSA
ncbi:MAG: hypothetical protein J7513_10865 [Solirubrobacteraceae bacterium]|nr:hypothetical protein [Solirubrobacteraceae bacterium]